MFIGLNNGTRCLDRGCRYIQYNFRYYCNKWISVDAAELKRELPWSTSIHFIFVPDVINGKICFCSWSRFRSRFFHTRIYSAATPLNSSKFYQNSCSYILCSDSYIHIDPLNFKLSSFIWICEHFELQGRFIIIEAREFRSDVLSVAVAVTSKNIKISRDTLVYINILIFISKFCSVFIIFL